MLGPTLIDMIVFSFSELLLLPEHCFVFVQINPFVFSLQSGFYPSPTSISPYLFVPWQKSTAISTVVMFRTWRMLAAPLENQSWCLISIPHLLNCPPKGSIRLKMKAAVRRWIKHSPGIMKTLLWNVFQQIRRICKKKNQDANIKRDVLKVCSCRYIRFPYTVLLDGPTSKRNLYEEQIFLL